MARGGARFEKGSAETQARMARVREARAKAAAAAVAPAPVVSSRAPFMPTVGGGVDVNEFIGFQPDFPQTTFGPNFLPDLPRVKAAAWPGDK